MDNGKSAVGDAAMARQVGELTRGTTMNEKLRSLDESAESGTARCGDPALPFAVRFSCPPQPWRRRMPLATVRLIPTPKIKLRRTASQSVAVMFGKGFYLRQGATVDRFAFAGLPPAPGPLRTTRRAKSADAVTGWPKNGAKESEKSEKWFFAIFQLQPAAAQALPTKIGCGDFSDFSKNSRGYTGGEGGEKRQNYEGRMKKSKSSLITAMERRNYRLLPLITAF